MMRWPSARAAITCAALAGPTCFSAHSSAKEARPSAFTPSNLESRRVANATTFSPLLPGAEQDRQKLRVRQRLGPARAQAFAGPLVRRHLANESTVLKGGGSHRRENTAGIAGSERREWHNLEA